MALSHIHKYLRRIRWGKIFLNKINLHRSLLPHSLMRQMNERGEKNLLLFQVCSMSSGQFFLWSQTILIRFTGHACGKFGFLAFISTVLESLSLESDGNTQFYEVF